MAKLAQSLCAAIAMGCALGTPAAQAEPLRLVDDFYSSGIGKKEDGRAPEITPEITKQVFAAMGQKVSIEFLPPSRAWSAIVRGERDGMLGVVRTGGRERICLFPDEPLGRTRSVLFVRAADADKLRFSSFDDLIGHDIAATATHSLLEHPNLSPELEKFLLEHHNIVETKGDIESLRMLASGHVDYAALSLSQGMHDLSELDLSGKLEPLLSHDVIERDVGICFAKGRVSPAFVAAFSDALKQFKQTGRYQAILRKYAP
jgi:polar amino acid transport system substrate-binding protein